LRCRESGSSYYALDNGYLGRDRYFRVVKNGFQVQTIRDRPPDRWEKLGLALLPWKKGGRRGNREARLDLAKRDIGHLGEARSGLDSRGGAERAREAKRQEKP
jgi:hypothetical protein